MPRAVAHGERGQAAGKADRPIEDVEGRLRAEPLQRDQRLRYELGRDHFCRSWPQGLPIGLPNQRRRTRKNPNNPPRAARLDKPPLLRHEQRVLLLPRRELHLGPGQRDLLLDVLDLHAVDARAAALDETFSFALGLGELGGD